MSGGIGSRKLLPAISLTSERDRSGRRWGQGIRVAVTVVAVNYVAPGFVDTEMMSGYAALRPKMEKQIPAGRFAHSRMRSQGWSCS